MAGGLGAIGYHRRSLSSGADRHESARTAPVGPKSAVRTCTAREVTGRYRPVIDDRGTQVRNPDGHGSRFRCESERIGTDAVLRITGDLAIETEADVRSAFIALLDQGLAGIVIDMRGVPFLDSSGMGLLAFAERMANMHDISLVVSGLRPEPRKALDTAGLAGLFLLED